MGMSAVKGSGNVRGRPFSRGDDPRRCRKPPGRPKKELYIPDILARIGAERLPAELKGTLPEWVAKSADKLEALMRATYLLALSGEAWAVQFVAERTEGKVKDTLHLEGGEARRLLVTELVSGEPGQSINEEGKDP